MKYIVERFRRFCGFITGFVFFISGILKLLDPVGAGLVMDEYFDFLHLSFLGFASKALGTAFALAETAIGTALITGVWRKVTAMTAIIFQGFFTLLTLALVIFNPQMDCGCFGEAIHLTHMQTFIKNLMICALLAMAFVPFRGFGRPRRRKYVSFGIVMTAVLAFTIYSWTYIPPVDFTDYRPGAALTGAGTGTEEIYEAMFIYEKDGVQEEFTIEHLPDSTWTFVSTETVLKSDASELPVTLSFTDAEGDYADRLATEGDVMVISVYGPEMKAEKWARIKTFVQEASEAGFKPLIIVAGTPETVPGEIPEDIAGNTYFSDYKTLITLNRSNGGATFFSEGRLICKWAYRAIPDRAELEELSMKNGFEQATEKDTKGSLGFQGFLLYVFAVMLLL